MAGPVEREGFLVDFQPMSPDEMQRMMQFLLSQQGRFDANLAKSQERFDSEMQKLSAKTDRITEGLMGLTSIVGQIAAVQLRTDEQLARLEEDVGTGICGTITGFHKVPGSRVPGSKVPGSKVPGSKVPGSKVPGSKVPGSRVPRFRRPNERALVSGVCERRCGAKPSAEWPLVCSDDFAATMRQWRNRAKRGDFSWTSNPCLLTRCSA